MSAAAHRGGGQTRWAHWHVTVGRMHVEPDNYLGAVEHAAARPHASLSRKFRAMGTLSLCWWRPSPTLPGRGAPPRGVGQSEKQGRTRPHHAPLKCLRVRLARSHQQGFVGTRLWRDKCVGGHTSCFPPRVALGLRPLGSGLRSLMRHRRSSLAVVWWNRGVLPARVPPLWVHPLAASPITLRSPLHPQ